MPLYLCRWPNGDCSIVLARNTEDAVLRLDETGAALPEYLSVMHSCLIDLALTDDGNLALENMGEDSLDEMDDVYPILTEAHRLASNAGENERSVSERAALISAAVRAERERLTERSEDAEDPTPH
jgi:hypothetical protein